MVEQKASNPDNLAVLTHLSAHHDNLYNSF